MTKESYYNHEIQDNKGVLFYNSLTDSYIILSENVFEQFDSCRNNLDEFKKERPAVYQNLYDNGFIVPTDFDEIQHYRNIIWKRRYTTNSYNVIINPTMDCNLNCWYCYESHEKGSEMTSETVSHILSHIKNQYNQEHFKLLTISFFGGEPLLKPTVVEQILTEIKQFTTSEGIVLQVMFTTNGSLIGTKMLDLLKEYSVRFQITIDGDKELHNTVRHYKVSKKGTYDVIIGNLKQIGETLENYTISLRINYKQETLKTIHSIVDDLSFANKSKMTFSLHQIWQVSNDEICWDDIFSFVSYARGHGFKVNILSLNPKDCVCYADNISEVIINYNGDVFKCTARDFTSNKPDGKLLSNGSIEWDIDKLTQRLYTPLPNICKECKLLPSCPGICSQHILEQGDNVKCILDTNLSVEDYIVYNFNRYAIENGIINK